jgi:hypothetical protein
LPPPVTRGNLAALCFKQNRARILLNCLQIPEYQAFLAASKIQAHSALSALKLFAGAANAGITHLERSQ